MHTPPDFYTSRPIGDGQSHPSDIRRLRTALRRTGHGRFPRNAAFNATPGLFAAIEDFQTDFGLTPDAVIEPGGPTEAALSMALKSLDTEGESGMEDLRNRFASRARAGLSFSPNPKDRSTGLWRDSSGRLLSEEEADAVVAKSNPQLAKMMMRGRVPPRPFDNILEGGGGGGGFSRGQLRLGDVFRGVAPQVTGGSVPKPGEDGDGEGSTPAAKRSILPQNFNPNTPPFPADPPEGVHNDEELPTEDREPTVTVSPIPELGLPDFTIFPDQSNLIEKWIVVENSRGLPHRQQKDLQYVIDGLYRGIAARGLLKYYEHTAGGRTAAGSPTPNEYMKERVVKPSDGGQLGSHRPDLSFIFLGLAEDLNLVDTLADGITPTARERRALAGIIANKRQYENSGATWSVGKSKGMSWEEYTAAVDHFLEILLDEMEKRAREHEARQKDG